MALPGIDAPNVQLSGIHAISESDIWAVGYRSVPGTSKDATLTMQWNGSEWSVVPSPNGPDTPTSKSQLYAVSGSAQGDVWAVGAYAEESAHFKSLGMRWDGTAWRIVETPNPGKLNNVLNDVTVVAPDDVWVVGSSLSSEVEDPLTLALLYIGTGWTR